MGSVISKRFVRRQLGLHRHWPRASCLTEHNWGSADLRRLLKDGSKQSTAHVSVYVIFPERHLRDSAAQYINFYGVSFKMQETL